MATITVIHHSDFQDKASRIVFQSEAVHVDGVGHLLRAVARDVPDEIAREYAANEEQFIVEGLAAEPPAALTLNAKDTIAAIEEVGDADLLAGVRASEEAREGGPRKSVLAAIEARFERLKEQALAGPTEDGDGAS